MIFIPLANEPLRGNSTFNISKIIVFLSGDFFKIEQPGTIGVLRKKILIIITINIYLFVIKKL